MTQFRLMEATTAEERIDELCRFIEFWLGPRKLQYGMSAAELAKVVMPQPLHRLMMFLGNWPHQDDGSYPLIAISAKANERVQQIRQVSGGKLEFLWDHDGNWFCFTEPSGDDPPVWVSGVVPGRHAEANAKVRIACDSLSAFLVTHTLMELSDGATVGAILSDKKLDKIRPTLEPVWLKGRYVSGLDRNNFYLWGDRLVAEKDFGLVSWGKRIAKA